jgi:hypothetical protein
MKAAGVLALMAGLITVTESKIYTRCKLAKIFSRASLDNYGGFNLGNCETSSSLFFVALGSPLRCFRSQSCSHQLISSLSVLCPLGRAINQSHIPLSCLSSPELLDLRQWCHPCWQYEYGGASHTSWGLLGGDN